VKHCRREINISGAALGRAGPEILGVKMSGTSSLDSVMATVSTGSGKTQELVPLSSASGISGTFVPVSPVGSIGASPLAVYNWDPATQLAGFLASLAARQGARIVTVGDSTTLGFGSAAEGFRGLSYPAELAQALTGLGVSAQSDNFLGQGNENGDTTDERVSLSGGAAYVGLYDAGGQVIETTAAGQAISFTLNTPGEYNQLSVSYVDAGSGSITVSVDGTAVGTLQFGNSGNTLSQTIAIPAGLHGEVTLTANSASPTYIQGAAFSSSTSNQVQIFNAAIGGWGAGNANTSVFNGQVLHGSAEGFGQVAGTAALSPNLALIDLGLNDITGFTNNGVPVPAATIAANIEQIIATYRAIGCDVILVLPQPFSDPTYAAGLPALRAALEQVSLADNVPIIDLSATYGNNFAALNAAGLMSDNLHPDATLYADIGTQIANLLANAINGTGTPTAATVQGTSGNDTLSSSAATSTLIGNGGSDTYNVAAGASATTIINGASTLPAGALDFSGLSYNQLWFGQSGENLAITVLGTGQSVVVQNWFLQAGSELADLTTSDGTLLAANVAALTTAMQAFLTLNPGFNPATSSATSLADSLFAGTLASAVQANWTTSGISPPCFCPGTLIATPGGPVPVENLRAGDLVTTMYAGRQRIKWIGRRTYKGAFANTPLTLPICLLPGAIADGIPARELRVSPGHAIVLEGWLVYAARLVNDGAIFQHAAQESVTYFHIELDTHEIIFAEDCPVESYREEGQRRQFENAGEYEQLYPGPETALTLCLPRLEGGFALDAVLRRLAARAGGVVPGAGDGGLRGYVDVAGPRRCAGWAQAEAAPEAPVCLDIFVDQRRAGRVLANRYRGDLRAAGLGSGNHGFELDLPDGIRGTSEVRRASDQAVLRLSTAASQP